MAYGRIEFDGFAISGFGFFVAFQSFNKIAQVGVGGGVRRIEFDGFAISGFGFFVAFQIFQSRLPKLE